MKIDELHEWTGLKVSGCSNILTSYVEGDYVSLNAWSHYLDTKHEGKLRIRRIHLGDWVMFVGEEERSLKDFV
jgi:hypothetical protein